MSVLISWAFILGDITSLVGTIIQGLLHTLVRKLRSFLELIWWHPNFQIILAAINGLMDVLLIWQCYHYAKWQQFTPVLSFLGICRSSSNTTDSSSPRPSTSPCSTSSTSAPAASKKSLRSALYHGLYVFLVIGVSIMVWGLVVARVRKTANLRPGEDGTDPEFSRLGAVFGWLTMLIYSKYPTTSSEYSIVLLLQFSYVPLPTNLQKLEIKIVSKS